MSTLEEKSINKKTTVGEAIERRFVEAAGIRLSYLTTQSSNLVIIVFLGFGQRSEKLQHLFELFPDNRLIILDPLLFGESTYSGNQKSLNIEDLKRIFQELFTREKIESSSIIAYSLGARFAMNLYLHFPKRVTDMKLIAPDGIVLNFWNRAMAYTTIGQWLYKFLMRNDSFYSGLLSTGQRLGVFKPSLVRFAKLHTTDEEQKERVLRLWILLRRVQPNFKKFSRAVQKNNLPLVLIFGKYDRVITHRVRKKAKRFLPEKEILLLEHGHNLLQREAVLVWNDSEKV